MNKLKYVSLFTPCRGRQPPGDELLADVGVPVPGGVEQLHHGGGVPVLHDPGQDNLPQGAVAQLQEEVRGLIRPLGLGIWPEDI